MKKIIAAALALVLMAGCFAGCGTDIPETTASPNGTLRVAVSPDFAPMEFVDPSKSGQNQYVGFDIALAKFIASEMEMDLQILPMDFTACQMAVYAGTVDMSISGYSWTAQREADYNLSDYYHPGGNDAQVLITMAEYAQQYATAESLAGVKIAAQNGSLQQTLAREQLPDSELVLFSDIGTAVLQLKNGDFDCIAVADGNAAAIIAGNTDIAVADFQFEVDEKYTGNVILLQKGNDTLTARVNDILEKAEPYYVDWYAQARSTAGIEVKYDENGNIAADPAETSSGE